MSISLNDHDRRIKDIEGKIVNMDNRLNNIIATAKSWEIISLTSSPMSKLWSYPSKFQSYKFALLTATFNNGLISDGDIISSTISYGVSGGNSIHTSSKRGSGGSVNFSKSESYITCNNPYVLPNITVIFYK